MYQPEQQQNKILTPGSGLQYALSEKQEGKRESLLQRIHIRTPQKCPRCKSKFKDVGNNLACPKCQTVVGNDL